MGFMKHEPVPDDPSLEATLLRAAPVPRLIAGSILFVAGVALGIMLWNRGVVAGITIFLAVVGLALVATIEGQREELIISMIAAKQAGKNPIRILNQMAIHDAEIRTSLIEEMNQRLKS